jgi:hypothetical protein
MNTSQDCFRAGMAESLNFSALYLIMRESRVMHEIPRGVSMSESTPPKSTPALNWPQTAVAVLRLPVEVLLIGGVVLLLWWLAGVIGFPGVGALKTALQGNNAAPDLIAFLIFFVGIAFAAFLWWLASRFYDLIRDGKISGDAVKELPLALPEGTVRAVLALIVGVVGLPLLLFSATLGLSDAIAGYVNGIIAGVFGFYFGTRTTGVPQQAVNQIVQANSQAGAAAAQATAATVQLVTEQHATAAKVDAATRPSKFDAAVDMATRNLGLASTLLNVVAPALPPSLQNLLPPGLKTAVDTASNALKAVQGITGATASESELQTVSGAVGALLGDNAGASGLGALVMKAAPMLSGLAIPGLGPVAGIGLLLSIGMSLGSAEFQRWRTRVLAAPITTGLIEFGTITPDEVHGALQDAPLFLKAFAQEKDKPGFDAALANVVLRSDALEQLWKQYGAAATPALFAKQEDLEAGLNEFRQVLLAARAAGDVTDDLAQKAGATLTQAANSDLRQVPAQLTGAVANQVIDAASKASASAAAPTEARAAFDALITLVGNARHDGTDLTQALTEVKA